MEDHVKMLIYHEKTGLTHKRNLTADREYAIKEEKR